jgi:NADH-quinone oxidoreductase subunit L
VLGLIPLIPLLPFAGFAVCGLLGRRLSKRAVAVIACGAVLLAFLLAVGAVIDLGSGGADRYAGRAGFEVGHDPLRFERTVGVWIPSLPMVAEGGVAHHSGGLRVDYGFQLDPLSAVMILVVTGVGFLIHLYSIGYMAHEEGFARFFTYLNLFMGMMLILVLANNFLLLFVGWEGVGLCSYLLIGFYTDRMFDERTRMSCSDAGRKAFIMNRVGDFAFMIGVLAIIFAFHSVDFSDVMGAINANSAGVYGSLLLTAVGVLLFLGACGKSAQIPLYVWLPDAMAGPTPVSALIHAATMVTAGVYMLARSSALFWHAPGAMMVVAVVGCMTALFAATMGLAQTDIKKVLAYSTVSQLGFMFLGAGVGAFVASIFHLMTHAFFKACLFLGSGSVIHAMGGEQDVRKMGGLKKWMPTTYKTFLIATIAIAGIPPFAGFFSKDEILFSDLASTRGHWLLWAVGSIAAFCTAFYMFRLVFLTFFGKFRGTHEQEHHLHESPRSMTVPLIVLATLAVMGGWIGVPRFMSFGALPNYFERALHPVVGYHGAPLPEIEAAQADRVASGLSPFVFAGLPGAGAAYGASEAAGETAPPTHVAEAGTHEGAAHEGAAAKAGEHEGGGIEASKHFSPIIEWGLVFLATLVAAAGIGLAYRMYMVRPETPAAFAASVGPLYALVAGKYYVDELYEAIVLKPFYGWCAFFSWLDRRVVDGAVNGARHFTVAFSYVSSFFDRWVVDLGVNGVGGFVKASSWVLRRAQTGIVQNYAAAMIFGSFVLLGIYLVYSR